MLGTVSNIHRNVLKPIIYSFQKHDNLDHLITNHFKTWSALDHQNKAGFEIALSSLTIDNPIIFETGTSAYGVDSSRLFNAYVRKFGGKFFSVDINSKTSKKLFFGRSRRTKYLTSDSVEAINTFSKVHSISQIDFAYLDSWDVDWNDPLPAAKHGLAEFIALAPYLTRNAIILIDDTPSSIDWIPEEFRKQATIFMENYGALPGKGALIFNISNFESDFEILYHSYNLVLRKK